MTEAPVRPDQSWLDAILDCPESDCTLVAYPYARISPDEFACTCRAGHTTTSNTASLRTGEADRRGAAMRRLLAAGAVCAALAGCTISPVTAATSDWIDDGAGLAHRQVTAFIVCYHYGPALSCVRTA